MVRHVNENSWGFLPPRVFGALSPEEYVTERISEWRDWYDQRASLAKRKCVWMRAATLIAAAFVPAVVNLPVPHVTVAATILSLTVTVLVSLETVFHFGDQWRNFRATEQVLAREYYYYVTRSGPYQELNADAAFQLLVSRVEAALESENASLLHVLTKVPQESSATTTAANPVA